MEKRDTVFFMLNTGDINSKEKRERNTERWHPYEQSADNKRFSHNGSIISCIVR